MNRFPESLVLVLVLAIAIVSCTKDASTPLTPPLTALPTTQPKGTITGLIKDRVTNVPIAGAAISFGFDGGVASTTSDSMGAFSFANVPAGQYQIVNGTSVLSGTYTVTVSLVNYNGGQADPNKMYRNYYYSTVTITFTSLATGDSVAVSDMVGSLLLQISQLNTTVSGQVVDKNMQPVANAPVMLYDVTVVPSVVIAQSTTSNTGLFQFTNVDNGLTINITAQSADGSLRGSLPAAFTLPANVNSVTLRPQVATERIMLLSADDVNPFVITITPENNGDVSPANLQIVYWFSGPIKQTAYTRTTLGIGHATIVDDINITTTGLKKISSPIPTTVVWNSTFTQLTVTPQGIVGSAKYVCDATAALGGGKLTDLADNVLVNNALIVGDFEPLNFTTAGGSAVPAAPTLVRRIIPGTFNSLDFGGGNIGLSWNPDANARSYNIYKNTGSGSFSLIASNVLNTQFTENCGPLYVGSLPNPFTALTVEYKVAGVSRDLVEGTQSNIITIGDEVNPRMVTASVVIDSTSNNARTNNVYYITVPFTEPMDIPSVENNLASTYGFANTLVPLTVAKADYLGRVGATYNVLLTVAPLGDLKPNGASIPTLTIQNTATDLAGNSLAVSTYSVPAFLFSSFEAAWTNGGQTPAGWTRTLVSGTTNWSQKTNPLTAAGRGGIPAPNSAFDGSSVAFFPSDSTAGAITRLESPAMNLSAATTPSLTFYYVNASGTDQVRVRYSRDGGTTWNTLATLTTSASTAWELHTVSLAVAAGQPSVLIGFEATSDGVAGIAGSDIWLDNIYVHQ